MGYEAGVRTPVALSAIAVAAYAVARLPATMAASREALGQLASGLGEWTPRSLLDVGSGLGSSTWAAIAVFPSLERLSLVEDSPAMIGAAQRIAATSRHRAVKDAQWITADATRQLEPADLVIAAYVLGEVDLPEAAVREWWRAAIGAILIIEPGTPSGNERILRARAQLVDAGAHIVAPCPHGAACPLPEPRWCHFAARVPRSRLHQAIKGGTLNSEDEKFSYVAATRFPTTIGEPRIIGEPARRGGHVRLEVCTEAGIVAETVPKSDPNYRRVRKLRWGDVLESTTGDPLASFASPHLSVPSFRRLTLSGTRAGSMEVLRKAVIRPVEIQGQRQLQVVTYDEQRATTTNVDAPTADAITELLRQPFRHAVVTLAGEIIEARVTKNGKLVTSRTTNLDESPLDLRHDRQKRQPIPEDAPFLDALGVSVDGRVKPTRRAKYRQINEFIRLIDQSPALEMQGTVRVLDVGCGNAYLTFATVYHLTHNRRVDCLVMGVDRNSELVERNVERARALGWSNLQFHVGDIETFEPDVSPDVVMALHACDTAADHALAAMVRWQAEAGFVAPCCHHHVQTQLRRSVADPGDRLLIRDGILRERLGDVITDATRAAILRLAGYEVDVVQFVDPDHTPRNTVIRASRSALPEPPGVRAAYQSLITRWSLQPLLAELLHPDMRLRARP